MRSYSIHQDRATQRWHWERLRPNERLAVAVVAAGCLLLFAAGWALNPDPRGFGTHEQLGLPACRMAALFHIPCPLCGITTAFSQMAHGRVGAAFLCQPAGALSFIACGLAFMVCIVFLVRGQWLPALLDKKHVNRLASTGLAVLGMAWIYKVATLT